MPEATASQSAWLGEAQHSRSSRGTAYPKLRPRALISSALKSIRSLTVSTFCLTNLHRGTVGTDSSNNTINRHVLGICGQGCR